MAAVGPVEKVAIIGATGHIGSVFVAAILKTGKHTVTALTRPESKGALPPGVERVLVDYNDKDSLVTALRGQDFLIITLSVTTPPDVHSKIVKAAAEAGVPYTMPSLYGNDIKNQKKADDSFSAVIKQWLTEMETLGVSYISLSCGVWYEWSLSLGECWFGFQIKERKVTFFDDGKTVINVSTWPQCGRALSALLSLPRSGASPCLADWKNDSLYISSFRVSQREMLDSLHRVLGTKDSDWVIKYEPTTKRAQDGLEEFSRGLRTGIAKNSYAKLFMRSKSGELLLPENLSNSLLGLPEESLDEATKTAVEMVESGWNPLTN